MKSRIMVVILQVGLNFVRYMNTNSSENSIDQAT